MSNKMVLCLIGVVAVFGVFGCVLVGIGVSANNQAVRYETQIQAQHKQNQNVLSQYSHKISEAVQVPAMYKDDFTKVVSAQMQGRYGESGSQATMQWIKEHNINFDSSMYSQIQRMIEAGRNDFEKEQKTLLDVKRSYLTKLDTVPSGLVMKLIGFPKIDLNKYDIVTSGYSDKAFSSGKENGLKLR